MFKTRYISMLVLLAAVATGAMAQTTYKVSVKEGTEDATSWTIAPAEATTTGVAAGTEVKATYSGTKKVKSVKAKKKAAAWDGTITAQLAAKLAYTGGEIADFTDATDDLTTMTWAVGEHIAILYEVSGTKKVADAEITAVDGTTGAATITFTVEDGTPDNTACTLVYPYSAAKDDHTGVKDAATLLAAQDGTLNANLDVRVGEGTIYTTTPGLTVTSQPAAQFAIWKLTLANNAKNLCIMADDITIAGATLGTAGTEFYVAVPEVSSKTVTIVANDASNNCYYYSKAGVSLAAGRYYQSSPSMTALDEDNSKPLYKITATSDASIPSGGKTVVLSGVNISSGSITCDGNVTMILLGSNSVTATNEKAAIKIGGSGTTLTITGSGSLTAQGGEGAAGIGTDYTMYYTLSGGNIVINGGTVIATGGFCSAGIGTGRVESLYGASITCGDITINGGTVTATGGNGAAGIGTGLSTGDNGSNRCGAITIGTGVISVTATKGEYSPNSIGKGAADEGGTQTCGTITIGGTIYWDGSAYQNGGNTYLVNNITYPTAP